MGGHTFRKIKEEQRCLLDLLNSRFLSDLGILNIETDEIGYIINVTVIGKFELEKQNILVYKNVGYGKTDTGIIFIELIERLKTELISFRKFSRCTLFSSLLSNKATRLFAALAAGSTTKESWDGFSANFRLKV